MSMSDRKWLAIFADVSMQPCLVVGAGAVAQRKIKRLLDANARITVVASEISQHLSSQFHQAGIVVWQREFLPKDIEGQKLVVAATNDESINIAIALASRERNIPVNVAKPGHMSTVTLPKVINRAPIQIAVASGGASPALMRHLHSELNTRLPTHYGQLANLLSEYRDRITARYTDIGERTRFIEQLIEGPVAEQIFAGRVAAARRSLEGALEVARFDIKGEVYIVGSGPGACDLLTLRAIRLMQKADIAIYDRLIGPEILSYVRPDAEKIFVGKARGNHTCTQDEINHKMIALAQEGKRVLRLKGGDPFIFGRGGEEIRALTDAGIHFEVVPGVTAANGCAAYAGIPLTHRDYAHSCIFLTGHLHDQSKELDWEALVQPQQTLVFYMGAYNLQMIGNRLLGHGLSPTVPAAIVIDGSLDTQQVIATQFGDLLKLSLERYTRALLIVGQSVRLSPHFKSKAEDSDR
ncbi:MAG: uroporphyrinogen-III C-methyltransferase [Ketobacter sp.]|nr:uroporphyrinogen-III C-methyltransferase [Ketobacter sp.]